MSVKLIGGSEGILGKASNSVDEHKKASYFEEIELEIMSEKADRAPKSEDEAFITSLETRLNEKSGFKKL